MYRKILKKTLASLKKGCKFAASNNKEITNYNLTTMKYQVRITENGKTRTLPATMTMEDAKWEIKMQKRLDEMVGESLRKYTIIEA